MVKALIICVKKFQALTKKVQQDEKASGMYKTMNICQYCAKFQSWHLCKVVRNTVFSLSVLTGPSVLLCSISPNEIKCLTFWIKEVVGL